MSDIAVLHAQFYSELKGYVYSRTKNVNDTEDILQDIFLKMSLHSEQLGSAVNLTQYIYGIVRNAISDYFRKRKPAAELNERTIAGEQEEDSCFTTNLADRCVRPFINQLPEKYRVAVWHADIEHIPQKELAKQLNISYSGLKSRVQRGRELLKGMLVKCCRIQNDVYGNVIEMDAGNCRCS